VPIPINRPRTDHSMPRGHFFIDLYAHADYATLLRWRKPVEWTG